MEKIDFVASKMASLIFASKESSNATHGPSIVFTGCGTSGRLGFFVARRFNELLSALNVNFNFTYACAGGDSALLLSDEMPEDDPAQGFSDLIVAASAELKATLLVGITCGLSAPYVAGQAAAILALPEAHNRYVAPNPLTHTNSTTLIHS